MNIDSKLMHMQMCGLVWDIEKGMEEELSLYHDSTFLSINFRRPVMYDLRVGGLIYMHDIGVRAALQNEIDFFTLGTIKDPHLLFDIHASFMDYRHRKKFNELPALYPIAFILGKGDVSEATPIRKTGLYLACDKKGNKFLMNKVGLRLPSPLDSFSYRVQVEPVFKCGGIDIIAARGTYGKDEAVRTILFTTRGNVMDRLSEQFRDDEIPTVKRAFRAGVSLDPTEIESPLPLTHFSYDKDYQ